MRVGGACLVLIALGSGPAVAADRAERAYTPRLEERLRVTARAEAYYGPQVALPGVTEQVVVDRGPRVLLEQDSLFGLFQPVYTSRRLPSRVRRMRVDADVPVYEAEIVATDAPRRRPARR